MEQAVNQFNKGLQMDTHPLVQGNDTLSDALNATFVTMNGNEVILQNDMGNRRVDNAYLPPGYEPVGIKEYGGIIYIAAYNPLTNKSQIGSFPSPERKLGDEYKDLQGSCNLNTAFTKEISSFGSGNYTFLKNDTVLIPLTDNNSLHVGDKFVVYSPNINESDNITNYKNTKNGKVISPKNKCYTLALGILNSQNEFVDITNTLARWTTDSNGKMVKKTYTNESELYKFNDEYFIPECSTYQDFTNTKADNELIQERLLGMQIQNANTYSYKLVGPLYLKATLNHIQDFTYNIYGNCEGNIITLQVTGTFIYNCPDTYIRSSECSCDSVILSDEAEEQIYYDENNECNCNSLILSDEGGDDDYISYNTVVPSSNFGFDLYLKDLLGNPIANYSKTISRTESIYDKVKNQYTVIITNKYEFVKTSSTISYDILVKPNSIIQDCYLKNLSDFGTINLDLLGTGEIKLNSWRFINSYSEQKSTIVYNISSYPKYTQEFKNLKIVFVQLNPVSDINNYHSDVDHVGENIYRTDNSTNSRIVYILEGTLNNGRNTVTFNWSDIGLIPRKVYDVYLSYSVIEDDEISYKFIYNEDEKQRSWFITTDLFNNWFDINDDINYVNDYNNPDENKLEEKLRIPLIPEVINDNDFSLGDPYEISDQNKLYLYNKEESSNVKILNTQVNPFNIKINPKLKLINEELYPDDLNIESYAENCEINLSNNSVVDIGDVEIYKENNCNIELESKNNFVKIVGRKTNSSSISSISVFNYNFEPYPNKSVTSPFTNISGNILVRDEFASNRQRTDDINIENLYIELPELIQKIYEYQKNNIGTFYSGITLDFDDVVGDDPHYSYLILNKTNPTPLGEDGGGMDSWTNKHQDASLIFSEERDDPVTFVLSDIYSKIKEEFNRLDTGVLFTWIFNTHRNMSFYPYEGTKILQRRAKKVRLWLRSINGNWLVGTNLIPVSAHWTTNNDDNKNNENDGIISDSYINRLFRGIFGTNLVVCGYKNYSLSGTGDYLCIPDIQNYTYNLEYSGNCTISILLEYFERNGRPTISLPTYNNIISFTEDYKTNTKEYNIPIKSSNNFQNQIDSIITSISSNYISNVYLNSAYNEITTVDIDGNKLKLDQPYIVTGSNLKLVKNPTLQMDGTLNDYYYLPLYCGDTSKKVDVRYDFIHGNDDDNHSDTYLDYNGMRTFDNSKIPDE